MVAQEFQIGLASRRKKAGVSSSYETSSSFWAGGGVWLRSAVGAIFRYWLGCQTVTITDSVPFIRKQISQTVAESD
jgi:hypothetical protein